MTEDGMPSSVLAIGDRRTVLRSWVESEARSLAMLGSRIEAAERAGRTRELARLELERDERVATYQERVKELER